MAHVGAGALQLFATLVAVALAARGAAAAVPIPSIMLTGDGGVISFTGLANTSEVVGVDVLSADTPFTANLLGSYADSKFAFTIALTDTRYRLYVTDLTPADKPKVLGDLLLPNGAFKADRCPEPIHKLLTVIKSGSGYKLFLATHCTTAAAKSCAESTGNSKADVISLYSYTYAPAAAGKLGKLTAGAKAVLPVPKCQRATLIGTQNNSNKIHLLASIFANAKDQAKNTGDLAVFELKSGFARSKGVLINKLSLVKTYRVAVSGLSISVGVPGSATSIFAVATDAKANTQIYNWAANHVPYVGGFPGTSRKKLTYDSITSVGGDCYTALEDATAVPADEPPIGLIQFSTAAQLKAGKPGTIVAQDIVPYTEITYVG